MPHDTRLIERWLPMAALGIESTRERTPMTPFPAPNRLHVWWARRPLVASRAAVLASLLPAEADRKQFLQVLGIHGDPVAAKRRIAIATRKGERLGAAAYGYARAFKYTPTIEDKNWVSTSIGDKTNVLDPTAGGGSVPFEAVRLGLETMANDLNPVASLIESATLQFPSQYGIAVKALFEEIGSEFTATVRERLAGTFPSEPVEDNRPDGYLWARTITCPYCAGLVPLSPNWRLAPDGTGIRLKPALGTGPRSAGRVCAFEIVGKVKDQSEGTVARGDGACPYPDCGRVIDGEEIKQQAQAGQMGEQLYAVVYKQRVKTILKSGKRGKDKWVRGYRPPTPADDNHAEIQSRLAEKLPEWEALDRVPSERFPKDSNDTRPIQYGMPLWRDLFSPRQLLCHGTSVEVFGEMLEADRKEGQLTDLRRAAYGYLALSLSKLCDYNARMCVWISQRGVIGHVFSQHDFSFKWSYAEMAPLVVGVGYDWAIEQTAKCIGELVALLRPDTKSLNRHQDDLFPTTSPPPPVTLSCQSGDSLDHIPDHSVDAVVMDPPYYDNVMYAELSDFFYVWLKRTAGQVFPELFRRQLTDKHSEAVANPARFPGKKGARALAGREYQDRMALIFAECRRVLKPDGILTLMFTHKATGAWDALATGLMEAGFIVTASWPINTEAEGSLHIRNKAAANSTIFLACRPRAEDTGEDRDQYWEEVEPEVAQQVRARIEAFQQAGIAGVDLYLATFGPALEVFSRHWPLKRGSPRPQPERPRRRQPSVDEEPWDPYRVTPEDALAVARREVRRKRLEQLTNLKAKDEMDPTTAFFVLAWDAFRAPEFSYDEALRLARSVGVDLDREIIGRLAQKKNSNVVLWSSVHRVAKGALGPADGSRGLIDAIHHAAHLARTRSLEAARDGLIERQLDRDQRFDVALSAVLEVLPVGRAFSGVDLPGETQDSGSDFEALCDLSRLLRGAQWKPPKQLDLWRAENA